MQPNALNAFESADVSVALRGIHKLANRLNAILLGPIPVMNEDGIDVIGHLEEDENYDWSFVPVDMRPQLAPVTPICASDPTWTSTDKEPA